MSARPFSIFSSPNKIQKPIKFNSIQFNSIQFNSIHNISFISMATMMNNPKSDMCVEKALAIQKVLNEVLGEYHQSKDDGIDGEHRKELPLLSLPSRSNFQPPGLIWHTKQDNNNDTDTDSTSFCDWTISVIVKQDTENIGCCSTSSATTTHFCVHRAVLAKASEYFAKVFRVDYLQEATTKTTVLHLQPSAAEAFPIMLNHVYHIEETSTAATLFPPSKFHVALLHLASYFDIPTLHTKVCSWIYQTIQKHPFQDDYANTNDDVNGNDIGKNETAKAPAAAAAAAADATTMMTYAKEAILYHDDKILNLVQQIAVLCWDNTKLLEFVNLFPCKEQQVKILQQALRQAENDHAHAKTKLGSNNNNNKNQNNSDHHEGANSKQNRRNNNPGPSPKKRRLFGCFVSNWGIDNFSSFL